MSRSSRARRPATRRTFLLQSATGAAGLAVGCGSGSTGEGATGGGGTGAQGDDTGLDGVDTGLSGDDTGASGDCPELMEDATYEGLYEWHDERERPLDELTGEGLDGRQVYDLADLEEDGLLTPTERFFVRTRTPAGRPDPEGWTVRVHGLVDTELQLSMDELAEQSVDQGVAHMECSGNTSYGGFGLQGAATWSGVPLSDVLAQAGADPDALVLVEGNDDHPPPEGSSTLGCSWVFTQQDLAEWGAFLAVEMNGEPLTDDHGFPVRLVMPGWYGCTSVKWVERIELVGADTPSTDHMREFALRTHQVGTPSLAADYLPAVIDLTAVPVRVERWRVEDRVVCRVVGILWGGPVASGPLQIRFGRGDWEDVHICPEREDARTWALWQHRWEPEEDDVYEIRLRIDDDGIETTRLDSEWYLRAVVID